MLILDMAHLSPTALKERVAACCSEFGHATVLKVLRPDGPGDCGAAAIEMSDLEEADQLARRLSGSRCGNKVIIRLVQEGQALPKGLKSHLSVVSPGAAMHEHSLH